MAGTVVVDAVKSSTTGAPTFQNTSGTEIGQLCRAWVNFNGTGTVAIRASFNVSSITDNGNGKYTANFTNAMPDANYTQVWSAGNGAGSGDYFTATIFFAPTTTGCSTLITNQAQTQIDAAFVTCAVFR